MTCWIWASLAPSCITMTMVSPDSLSIAANSTRQRCRAKARRLQNQKRNTDHECDFASRLLIPFFRAFLLGAVRVHGIEFASVGFVHDAVEEAADGGVGC